MINQIELINFKSIEHVDIKLSNLNLFTGVNSAGKSSVIQSVLLMEQYISDIMPVLEIIKENSFQNKKISSLIPLNGDLVQLGYIRDVLFDDAKNDKISVKMNKNNQNITMESNENINLRTEELNGSIELEDISAIISSRDTLQYLSANRIEPRTVYPYSTDSINKNNLGIKGEYTAHYLAKNKNNNISIKGLKHEAVKTYQLLENVSFWLSKVSFGITPYAEINEDNRTSVLRYSYENNRKQLPQNVGYGITYVLPIIVSIFKAKVGDLLIVENPETHLHPKAQVEISKLFCRAAELGVQIIIESHSDHILNGIRVGVKNKEINKENVNILYFKKEGIRTRKEIIDIADDGSIDNWPEGFFDEWQIQLDELLW